MTSKLLPRGLPPDITRQFFNAYLVQGDLHRARELFNTIPDPDLRSLTILISAFTKTGRPKESIVIYKDLRSRRNLKPDKLVLLALTKACAASSDLLTAKEVHEDVILHGFGSDPLLANAMIDMYGKCRCLGRALTVFEGIAEKDVVSWTSLISGYANCGLPGNGLGFFCKMLRSRVKPNSVTLSTVLPLCSDLKIFDLGRQIHLFALRNGLDGNPFVISALVDFYSKCLRMRQAKILFDVIPRKDVVLWNVVLSGYFSNGNVEEALQFFEKIRLQEGLMNIASWNSAISGCQQNGRTEEAFVLFAQMQELGFRINQITISSILPACSDFQCLRSGKEIHSYILRHEFFHSLMITTALVLMYAKCGDLEGAQNMFDVMPQRDTVAWNTIILANSMHGRGEEVLLLFKKMLMLGINPNSVTFTSVLSGCSHSRLVKEAREVFDSMARDHGIPPDADHHACMADVLGRSGHLQEAYNFIKRMPMAPTASAWGALLGSCRVYKNADLGKIAAEHLFQIEPKNPGNYILLSNVYVASKMWGDASNIRSFMRAQGVKKAPGCSWIQIKNKVFTFFSGEEKNPLKKELQEFLKLIIEKMRLEGYKPDTDFVLQDVVREEGEEILCNHSEKLAVAFGMLNLNGLMTSSTIRVFKNLRICGDCHNVIKYMSKITSGRWIIVRDNVRFHHFYEGDCSCGDKW